MKTISIGFLFVSLCVASTVGSALIDTDTKAPKATVGALGPHRINSLTPAPGESDGVAAKLRAMYNKAKQVVGVGGGATDASSSEKQGKWDRILVVGDLHGDLKQALELFKDLSIISHQPDYYKDLVAKRARDNQVRIAKGKKPKSYKNSVYTDNGLADELQQSDITANMLYNKRGDLMGGTADEFHWSAGKILLVVLGDALNVGPDDLAIVQLLRRLTEEAHEYKGEVVYVLGNHEMNNLKGNYMGVHPWSFESSGGEEGRRRILSTENRLGRFLRSRPAVYYYDHLMFMHGGLFPAAIETVEKATGHKNMTGSLVADTINQHVKMALFDKEDDPDTMDDDPIAAIATNVDYNENGDKGVLLVHPLDKCPLVEEANQMALLQAQVVGHTPHNLPDFSFCAGSLFAIDFMLSQWKGGQGAQMAALELTRVPLQEGGEQASSGGPNYRWSPRLLLPQKDTLAVLNESHKIARVWFVLLVIAGVAVVESLIALTRHVLKRRKALASFL